MQARTILLVDDSPRIRPLIREILSASTFQILEAGDAEQALQIAADHGGNIDLLLTDLILPGMNGLQLAAELLLTHPGIRVLCMSGYALPTAGAPEMAFLEKPFRPETLLRKVLELCPE